ncbi:MAG: serine hydrolase [Chitinophagaceae bacterium]|nr:serine hydrolase [Chitinophagaceae bacterium]
MKKIIKRIALLILLSALAYGIYYLWVSFPIISGYGAKNLCSCVFVAGRNEGQVKQEELGSFPLTLGSFTVNYKDSSVTGKVWGIAEQKAIYRNGFGCTLVNGLTEKEIRSQQFPDLSFPASHADTSYWPMGNRVYDTIITGLKLDKLKAAVQNAFTETDTTKLKRTRAVVVLYGGQLVAEQYAPGFTKDTRLMGWSMSKSLAGTLVGMLVKQGKLKVDGPAPVPEWKDPKDPRHAITLENLLQQTSGLDFEENYGSASEATNMLFKSADMAAYTAQLPLKEKPGTSFYYSSGNSNILSRIVRHTTGEKEYHAFPYTALFHKLGMYSMIIEPDASGTFVGSSYSYATARDWARFGLFYLRNGNWAGEQLIPEDWVRRITASDKANPRRNYGYQFWLNGFTDSTQTKRLLPDVPADLFYADGYEGQFVFIIPSKKLVVVRLGLTKGDYFDVNRFLAGIIAALPE